MVNWVLLLIVLFAMHMMYGLILKSIPSRVDVNSLNCSSALCMHLYSTFSSCTSRMHFPFFIYTEKIRITVIHFQKNKGYFPITISVVTRIYEVVTRVVSCKNRIKEALGWNLKCKCCQNYEFRMPTLRTSTYQRQLSNINKT